MESSDHTLHTEIELWYQKANIVADNLLQYQENGLIPIPTFCDIVKDICQATLHQEPFQNPFLHTEAENTIYYLEQIIRYSFEYGSNMVVMVPMLNDLVESGTQTTTDFIQFLVNEIVTGITQESEELDTEADLEEIQEDVDSMPDTEESFEKCNSYCLGASAYRDCDKAIVFGEKAVGIAEKIFSPDDIRLGDSQKNLALAHLYNEDLEIASELMEKAYEIALQNQAEFPAEANEIEHQYAIILQATNRYDQAEKLFYKVLSNRRMLFGPKHPFVAKTLGDLSRLLSERGCSFEEATAPLLESLQILEHYKQTNTPQSEEDHDYYEVIMDLIIGYNNLGYRFYEEGRWEESYEHFSKSCDNTSIYYEAGYKLSQSFVDLYFDNLESLQDAVEDEILAEKIEELIQRFEDI